MSTYEEKVKELTTGFTLVAETRRKEDVHEGVYADKALLLPTLGLLGLCLLGLIFAILAF